MKKPKTAPVPELPLEDQWFLMKFEILSLRYKNSLLIERLIEYREWTQSGVGGVELRLSPCGAARRPLAPDIVRG